MPVVTLLEKAQNDRQLRLISNYCEAKLKDLDVRIEACRTKPRGWVQVSIVGEDERIALNLLTSDVGVCPTHFESLKNYSAAKGFIIALDGSKNEVVLDIGIFAPDTVDATIPLHNLQAQLADGRKLAFKKLSELFGLCIGLPLHIKIYHIDQGRKRIEAMLAEQQLARFRNWTRSLLDRLEVLGASLDSVESSLKRADCERDIVNVEHLGILEHAVVCKLGTDARGLIPKIGKHLREATLKTFNPRAIAELLGYDSPLLTSIQ